MDYQAKFAIACKKRTSTEEAKQLYFSELESAFYKVKSAADEILAINQDTMVRKSDDVRRTAERMNAITITVALAALALGLFVSTLLTRRMLQPLSALSEATRKIGEGNFDTRAHVRGNDELAQLGAGLQCHGGALGGIPQKLAGRFAASALEHAGGDRQPARPGGDFQCRRQPAKRQPCGGNAAWTQNRRRRRKSLSKPSMLSTRAVLERMRSHVLSRAKARLHPERIRRCGAAPHAVGRSLFLAARHAGL